MNKRCVCGKLKNDHTEAEAIYCVVNDLRDLGYRTVLPPGVRIRRRKKRAPEAAD
jgi:hypothetical protein